MALEYKIVIRCVEKYLSFKLNLVFDTQFKKT